MKMITRLTVGSKLALSFAVMIFFITMIGLMGYYVTSSINAVLNQIVFVNLPSIDYLIQADRALQQLLVAERSMIFSNTQSDIFRTLVDEYEENLKQSDQLWQKYKAIALTPAERAIIPKYEKAREEWEAISRKVVEGRGADAGEGHRKAFDLSLGLAKDKFEEMRKNITQLTGMAFKNASEDREKAGASFSRSLAAIFFAVALGLAIGIALMVVIGRSVTRPLKTVIQGLTDACNQVAAGSEQVSSASQSLAEGASEQAASIEETSSSLEEMSSITKQNADNAGHADSLMKEAKQVISLANESMARLIHSMEEISRSSEETSKIVKTIDEIAFQTNLLALNAAVEAARAGEAGAGFAVVADEVRNLAMRAAEAAKNTSALIEGTVKRIEDGSELVTKTSQDFGEVAKAADAVGKLVAEIAGASDEQAQGIGQVSEAVGEMDKAIQQNAAHAEESASASEEMSAQAKEMKTSVQKLITLVAGQGARPGEDGYQNAGKRRGKPGGVEPPRTGPSRHKPVPSQTREPKPEEVIPFHEEEFKDF
jgi:methyl-accepting chemotaxis protein